MDNIFKTDELNHHLLSFEKVLELSNLSDGEIHRLLMTDVIHGFKFYPKQEASFAPAEYRQLWPYEFEAMRPEDLRFLYFSRNDIEGVTDSEDDAEKKQATQDHKDPAVSQVVSDVPAVVQAEIEQEKTTEIRLLPKHVVVSPSGNGFILKYLNNEPAIYTPARQSRGWKYLLHLLENPGRSIPFLAFEQLRELSKAEAANFDGLSEETGKSFRRPKNINSDDNSPNEDSCGDGEYYDTSSYINNVKTKIDRDYLRQKKRELYDHRKKIQLHYEHHIATKRIGEGSGSHGEDQIRTQCLDMWEIVTDAFKEETGLVVMRNWDSVGAIKCEFINPIRANSPAADLIFRRVKKSDRCQGITFEATQRTGSQAADRPPGEKYFYRLKRGHLSARERLLKNVFI